MKSSSVLDVAVFAACAVLYTEEAPHMALVKELAGVLGGLYP